MRTFLLPLVTALLAAAPHAFAQVDFNYCLNSCFNTCNSGPQSLAWGCRERCGDQCAAFNKNRPAPYGSIAFGSHGAEGISWNKIDSATADNAALASCRRYANDCKIVYRYQNTCAALAVAKGAQHFESATGGTENAAKANSEATCRKQWGTCVSNLSACSFAAAKEENAPGPAPAGHATSWGAIAFSASDMQAGWSMGKADRALAEQEAMKSCSARGKSCVLQTVFNKQCAALAWDRGISGSATAADAREANAKAVAECKRSGGLNCALHISFCSF